MESTLFIILPYTSHLLAVFDFAKRYRIDGSKVIFTSTLLHKNLIESKGFLFEELVYIEEEIVARPKVFFAYIIQSLLNKKQSRERYKRYYNTLQIINSLCQKYEIRHIFIDEYIADYYFLIDYKRKVSIVNTRLSTKQVKGIPPLNSSYVPNGGFFSSIVCEGLWMIHLSKRKLKQVLKKIAFLGADETYFLARLGRKNGKNYQKEIDNSHCLNKSIKDIITYNLSPQELEFPFRKPQTNEVFVFDSILRNENSFLTSDYYKFEDELI